MTNKFRLAGINSQLDAAIDALQDAKAENITIIHGGEDSPVADWIIICEGNSFVHVRAIADQLRDFFKRQLNELPFHEEGQQHNRWILLDYTDIVLNIMLPELRMHYQLEDLWKECDQENIPNL